MAPMTTGMRRAWRHVKYTSSDLRDAREGAEQHNERVRRAQESRREWEGLMASLGDNARHRYSYPMYYGSDAIVDPDLAEPESPRWRDRYGWKGQYILGTVVVVVVALILGLTFGIRGLAHSVDHRECPRKAAAMGVQAQWVDYSFFGWECLANIDGRWVPIDTVHNDTGVWIRGGSGQ